jgi:hypothetical protein
VLHFSCCHVRFEQTRMQPAECLTQTDQLVLIAFVLPTQDLAQQGGRVRRRLFTLHTRLTKPECERRFDHQQPHREPRVIVDFARAGKFSIEAPAQRASSEASPSPDSSALNRAGASHASSTSSGHAASSPSVR